MDVVMDGVVEILIARYDYCGALEILKNEGHEKSDAAILMDSCRHAINFDFKSAKYSLYHISDARKNEDTYQVLLMNLESLIKGDPDALFSELLENLKFQIVNEEYIDFLGRIYRFKEAIYKYMFIKKHLGNRPFTFHIRFMQKSEILKILRNHYKIYNNNLLYGINAYFKRYDPHNQSVQEVRKILNASKMNQLIELRHESLIGHGFKGVSLEEIEKVYGDPYCVLDDFKMCLSELDVTLFKFKYSVINDYILSCLKKDL